MAGSRVRTTIPGPTGSAVILLVTAAASSAQIAFVDESWRLRPTELGDRWPTVADLNGDGRLDLLVGDPGIGALALQDGRGRFIDVGRHAGMVANRYTTVVGDYDNDGVEDIFTAGFREPTRFLEALAPGRFDDRTTALGVHIDVPRPDAFVTGLVFADYDRDGDLDLFAANERGRDTMFRNDGGSFTDVTQQLGLDTPLGVRQAYFSDFDNDGDLDLLTPANQRSDIPAQLGRLPSALYEQRDGRFENVTSSSGISHTPRNIGSIVVFDYDNDGWFDIFLPNASGEPPVLWRNEGGLTFSDRSAEAGFSRWFTRADATAGDYDNDGWMDLYLASFGGETARDLVFHNRADGTFTEILERTGIPLLERSQPAAGVSTADLDGDGYLDLFITGFSGDERIYANRGSGGHWLVVELVGSASNRNAFGARLHVQAGELRLWREVVSGDGYRGDSRRVHFGLAANEVVDRLEVCWPSGRSTRLSQIDADQHIRVIEGQPRYHEARATVWAQPPPDTVAAGFSGRVNMRLRPSLFEEEGEILSVVADLSSLGGDARSSLAPVGGDVFELAADIAVRPDPGLRTAWIDIRQQTSLGVHRSSVAHPVAVVPDQDHWVYRDALGDAWRPEPPRAGVLGLTETDSSFGGRSALLLEPDRVWAMQLWPTASINAYGYEALELAILPLAVEIPPAPRLNVRLSPGPSVNLVEEGLIDLGDPSWQVVRIPWEALVTRDTITAMSIGGNVLGTVQLDEIRFAARRDLHPRPTAVESLSQSEPTVPILEPNYPNPFNGETVFRFYVETPASATLEVYDTLGQRVATMVRAAAGSGWWQLAWDGRDDSGSQLASGVYLYRMLLADVVVTDKLVLLR